MEDNIDIKNDNEETNDVSTRYNIIWKLMEEKGLTFGERMQVRKVIADWAYQFNPNIEHNHKNNTYTNKQVKNYSFEREDEAEFIGALVKFIPNADTEKLIQVMSMILKLFDVESVWTWKGTR
jgi:hypothetical protein